MVKGSPKLRRLKNLFYLHGKLDELYQKSMKNKQFSFGIIPLKRQNNGWNVFLVKHNKGHWGFPKGHALPGETPEQIARRELFEETGLSVTKFFQVSPIIEKYVFQENNQTIDKTVTYFLAEVEGTVHLMGEEIANAKWASFEVALDLLTFEEAKQICKEGMQILNALEEEQELP